ncbi:hypothetical protein AAVH_17762 [Aphelenchoides avenae]|nr:hypothetical protein AAVH_17762 [Aphelenchus avenae]
MDGAMTPLREPLGPLPILSMASRNEVPLPSPPDKAKRRLRMLRVKDTGYRFRKVIWSDPVCLCLMLVLVVVSTVLLTLLLSAGFRRNSISRSSEETSLARKVRVDFSVVDQYWAWLRAHDQMYGPTAQRINRQTCKANLKKLRAVLEYVQENYYQNTTALADTSLSSDAEVEQHLDKARMEFQRLYNRRAVIDEANGDVVVQPSIDDLKFVLDKYQSHELSNVNYYECRMEAASVRKQLDILQRAMKGTTSTAQPPDLPTEPASEE